MYTVRVCDAVGRRDERGSHSHTPEVAIVEGLDLLVGIPKGSDRVRNLNPVTDRH